MPKSFLKPAWRSRDTHLQTHIDAPKFPASEPGQALADLMSRIHGRLSDDRWIQGVDVFRRLYAAVDFGQLVPASRWPGIAHLLDLAHAVVARNRARWFGRCTANTRAVEPGQA
jgi:predicted DCC family thiol-disulfide oxidoreductase YuxK